MSVQFNLRDFGHPWLILRLRSFFERSQWFSRQQLVEYQSQRLRLLIAHAVEHVPYYRDLFRTLSLRASDIGTVSDLKQLPVLTKKKLLQDPESIQAIDKQRYCPTPAWTSGTSGQPLAFLLDRPSNVLEFVYYWRHWSWAGYRLRMPFAELSSSYFLRLPDQAQRPALFQYASGRLLLNSLTLSPERVHQHVGAIRRYRPLFLKGTPSALYWFAMFLQENGVTDISFRAIFSTGEMLYAWQRAQIEAVLHGKVYDSYGHMERTIAVSECPQGGYHINPEYGILELVPQDSSLDACRPRHAKIIGTSLHNYAMPLIRYEVGDIAELLDEDTPCQCGRAAPRIRRILGRQNDVIVTPEGQVVPTLFTALDRAQGISMGQFIQETIDRLRIRIVKRPEFSDTTERALLQDVRQRVGTAMRLEVEYLSGTDALRDTSGKFRAVISHVNQGSGSASVQE